jgi:hypothetical protein
VARRTAWPVTTQIRDQSLSKLREQREAIANLSLAENADLPRPPVDIFELQARHLARTQSQPSKEKQDGVVTTTLGCRSVAAR